jgi:hypothetical protein
MIPTFVKLRVKEEGKRGWNLWLPLIILYILFAPILIILLPILVIVLFILALTHGAKVFRSITYIYECFSALSGLTIDVDSKNTRLYISII